MSAVIDRRGPAEVATRAATRAAFRAAFRAALATLGAASARRVARRFRRRNRPARVQPLPLREPTMKTRHLPLLIASAALAASLTPPPAAAQTCTPLEVQNLRPGAGTLMVAVFASEEEFSKKPIAALQMRASDATTLRFPICVAAGTTVALTLYQDINDNGRLDANVLGIPTEPWGASGQTAAFTAPSWASAQVPLDGKAIVIKLSQ